MAHGVALPQQMTQIPLRKNAAKIALDSKEKVAIIQE